MSRANLWTALRVVYGFVHDQVKAPSCLWFCSGKSSEVRSSSVTVGGSLSLVVQAIDHFRYFVLFPQTSEPRFRSFWISSVADSSRGVMETNSC